jgi:excisionase family DNA binding protein
MGAVQCLIEERFYRWLRPADHRRIRMGRKMIMGKKSIERLMTLPELSEMLGVPIETLYGWRHRGDGPVGYRIGRHVRYRRAAVEEWLETQADRRDQMGW